MPHAFRLKHYIPSTTRRHSRKHIGTTSAAASTVTDSTINCDITIIGAGAAGLAACVEAGESGFTTLCIESQDSTGGNERFVEGCFAVGSSMQKEGLEYSTGSLIKQELEQTQYRVSGIMYNEMVHRSGENLDWLLDHGVQFMSSAHADSLIIAAGGDRPQLQRGRYGRQSDSRPLRRGSRGSDDQGRRPS